MGTSELFMHHPTNDRCVPFSEARIGLFSVCFGERAGIVGLCQMRTIYQRSDYSKKPVESCYLLSIMQRREKVRAGFFCGRIGTRKLFSGMTRMLRKIEGTVRAYRAIDVRNVQFEIQGVNNVIELNVGQPWILKNGDYVVVAGEDDGRSGKFNGYAYRNDTKEIFGKSDPGLLDGYRYILMGLLFSWAIFPVFIHIPAGLRRLKFGRKIDQAASMLWSTNG